VKRNEKVTNNKDVTVKAVFMKDVEVEFKVSSELKTVEMIETPEVSIVDNRVQGGSNMIDEILSQKAELGFEELLDVCLNHISEDNEIKDINIEKSQEKCSEDFCLAQSIEETQEKCREEICLAQYTDTDKKGVS